MRLRLGDGTFRTETAVEDLLAGTLDSSAEYKDDNAIDDPWLWTVDDVVRWLQEMHFEKYTLAFQNEEVDGKLLLCDLNEDNLSKELGVSSVHMSRFMRSLADLRDNSPIYEGWKEKMETKLETRKARRQSVVEMAAAVSSAHTKDGGSLTLVGNNSMDLAALFENLLSSARFVLFQLYSAHYIASNGMQSP